MRIAFTSCFSADICGQQPVWGEIAQAAPDVLVLLGDAVYLDCSLGQNAESVKRMAPQAFAQHVHACYAHQLAQPDFRQLLADLPALKVHAIWDDHDFLWDNAHGGDLPVVLWASHLDVTRFYFDAFQRVLRDHAPDAFPSATAWSPGTRAPGYRKVPLTPAGDVLLHLTDGRSWRSREQRRMLGELQMDALAAGIENAPDAVHLVASGSTFESLHGESWLKAPAEHARLCALARKHRVLVLSGDVHKVLAPNYPLDAGGRFDRLYEATASGAGVRTLVSLGSPLRNFGLLDIDDAFVRVKLSQNGNRIPCNPISRADWRQAG